MDFARSLLTIALKSLKYILKSGNHVKFIFHQERRRREEEDKKRQEEETKRQKEEARKTRAEVLRATIIALHCISLCMQNYNMLDAQNVTIEHTQNKSYKYICSVKTWNAKRDVHWGLMT